MPGTMNGWNGFRLPGIPGMTGQVGPLSTGSWGSPVASASMPSNSFAMPQGAQPEGWFGYNGMETPGQTNGGWFGINGLGKNLNTLRMGVQGLGTIAGLWNGYQQNKLAKASFNHQRGLLDTNLANQIKAYNLSIEDKFRSRAAFEGTSNAERDEQIARNRATDERKR